MSTVLWANVLGDGKVKSDQADHLALYQHAEKLDALAAALGLPSFLAICDTTDQRFNIGDLELPPGMTSTEELMAQQGAWMPLSDAVALLQTLLTHIVERNIRFGLLSNQQALVLDELDEVLTFVKTEAPRAEKFNFAVVM